MTSTTGNNELSTPLLCNLPQHESDAEDAYDEECCMPCSLKNNVDDNKEEESDDESSQCTWWCDNFVSLIVLPAFLFLSFGEVFYTSSIATDTGLCWYVVNYSIVIFAVSATVYRQVLQECKLTYLAALLLPEIIVDICLDLVLFGKVVPAFLLMLISTLCLAVFVVTSGVGVWLKLPE